MWWSFCARSIWRSICSGKRLGEFFFFLLFKGIPIGILGTLLLGGCGPAGVVEFLLFFVRRAGLHRDSFLDRGGGGHCVLFHPEYLWPCLYQERPFIHPVGRRGASLPFPGECGRESWDYLPFAGMVTVPVYTYLGKYSIQEAMSFIGLQVVWCVLLGALVMAFYQKAIKKVVVQGG